MFLRCGKFELSLSRPLIMGVVNVTPDSFSDGGLWISAEKAAEHALRLVKEGADILDVGGESSRPGALPVSVEDELRRVLPVLERLKGIEVPISVDTVKPEVMRQAIRAGASMINDINALLAPSAMEAVAGSGVGVCLMHMQGDPQTMQKNPQYKDVVAEVKAFLESRVREAEKAGISRERLVLDPGFGFGKTVVHNLALLRRLQSIASAGLPVLAGLSRKSILGVITGNQVEDRLPASIAAALIAVANGAKIVRVHDVKATRDALAVFNAVMSNG